MISLHLNLQALPKISDLLLRDFPFTPTAGQQRLFQLMDQFIQNEEAETNTLILKGYAGTGKTTVVSTLVKVLPLFNYRFMLLAPTGRAAKVMSSYAQKMAFTIHKIIYKSAIDPDQGGFRFTKVKNYHKKTIFMIDEASMLSDEYVFGKQGLLADLLEYVFEHHSNKLILIGDEAQLPPVKQNNSPALQNTYLENRYKLKPLQIELTEVMRQDLQSGILHNATHLRKELNKNQGTIHFHTSGYKDIFQMTGEKMEEGLRYAYDKYGIENVIVVCRSNKQAVNYNHYIRQVIHFYDNEIEAGDILMIVKNNYFYLPEDSYAGFIANGDFARIMKIVSFEELFGFRFATLQLQLVDYPNEPEFEAKVILDTLHSNSPNLSFEESKKLYQEIEQDYLDIKSLKKRREAILNDPYLNALQVKFAYALTCHKSQGGQWNAVFVEQGYLTEDQLNKEYLRWLYTAVTRATHELFLVNFKVTFFK